MPQPFLLLLAANLALAGFLGWKWSLWPVPTWLAVQRSKAVFFLNLHVSINDMKHFWTVCITPKPCHSHFWCWLLLIWPKLNFSAENGAYGLCWLGWRYNGENLYFSWPYMIVSMIWNTSELSASHLSCDTAIFAADCFQFVSSWIFGLKMKLMAYPELVGGTTEKSYLFPDLICYYQWYETLPNCLHYTSAVAQPFLLLIAANLALAGFLDWKLSLWYVPAWLAVQRSKAVF